MVAGPVLANVTRSVSPTASCLASAVVVSIRSSPAASAGSPDPDAIRRLIVCDSPGVVTPPRLATEPPIRN